ncbi:hypothetical protein D920_01674 [Enterococcus faecalis 13-SD-W-01]|nr:hypothetical protein D920_01674 [Enterococcus faecalis 13-SD-W-01]
MATLNFLLAFPRRHASRKALRSLARRLSKLYQLLGGQLWRLFLFFEKIAGQKNAKKKTLKKFFSMSLRILLKSEPNRWF